MRFELYQFARRSGDYVRSQNSPIKAQSNAHKVTPLEHDSTHVHLTADNVIAARLSHDYSRLGVVVSTSATAINYREIFSIKSVHHVGVKWIPIIWRGGWEG